MSDEQRSDRDARWLGEQSFSVVEDTLFNLWQAVNHLSGLAPPPPERYRVTIFGSARVRPGQPVYDEVKAMAAAFARQGCDVVTGGGPGLMQAANEGAQLGDPDDESDSIGVRIALPFEQGANPYVERLFTHQTFFTRLHQFVRLSHAFVIVGGGLGTTLETMMVWQLLQVRHLDDVPLVFVGPMWAELVAWARKHMLTSDPHLADAEDLDIPICVDDAAGALAVLEPRIEAFKRG